mgnify:CR=1 FL=1
MFIDRTKFTYLSGRIRVLEMRLLNANQVERMIGAPNAHDAFHTLHELDFAPHISAEVKPADFQDVLWKGMLGIKEFVEKQIAYAWFLNIFWHVYDVHNIKVLLKAKHSEKSFEDVEALLVPLGAIKLDALRAFIMEGHAKTSFGLRKKDETILKDAIARAEAAFKKEKDPAELDFHLDAAYFTMALRSAKDIGSSCITRYIQQHIDFANIRAFMRIKLTGHEKRHFNEAFVEGGTLTKTFFLYYREENIENFLTGLGRHNVSYALLVQRGYEYFEKHRSFFLLEKEMDDRHLEFALEAKKFAYGPEVVFAYVFAHENNAKIIRMILVSKLNGVPPEQIRKELRHLYSWQSFKS